jgi:hypothetical protein
LKGALWAKPTGIRAIAHFTCIFISKKSH